METPPPLTNGWSTPLSVSVFATCVVFAVLTIVFTGLRFVARLEKHARYGLDDWVILAAAAISVANAIVTAWGAAKGYIGPSVGVRSSASDETFPKLNFASNLIAIGALALVKIAILLLYRRIFAFDRFRLIIHIMIGISVAWFLAFFLAVLFSANPISSAWSYNTIGRYDFGALLTASGYTDLIIDIVVLLLPVPMIKTLQLDFKRKLSVAGILSLGFFCIVATSIRLHYIVEFSKIYNGSNPAASVTRSITFVLLWANIEPCCSIIAACLPTLTPLFKRKGRSFFGINDGKKKTTLERAYASHSHNRVGSDRSTTDRIPGWNAGNSAAAYASGAPWAAGTELHDLENQALTPTRDTHGAHFDPVYHNPRYDQWASDGGD